MDLNFKKMKLNGIVLIFSVPIFLLASCSEPNCENDKSEYTNGYAMGTLSKTLEESGSCQDWVDSYNEASGGNKIATDCFCGGFNDGMNGKEAQF